MVAWIPISAWAGLWSGPRAAQIMVTGSVLGSVLLLANLWLATRFGPAAAIGVTLIGLVLSLIFGASQYATSNLWLLGPWLWAYSADTWTRTLTAGLTSIAAGAALWPLWTRSVRTAAATRR